MKYLFLDIDGVLNHEDWYINKIREVEAKRPFTCWWEECFDPECVKRLNQILTETGARLVVSSSWRLDMELKKYFETVGIPTDFDITPSLTHEDENGVLTWPDRGEEVELFLRVHPCDNYVILDDDKDFTEDQLQGHFVHCCCDFLQAAQECHPGETGLTELKMREAINILNR
jgi:hypothetical protein